MDTKQISAEQVRELLDYDPENGIFTWKVSRRGVKAGNKTGSVDAKGYLTIRLNRRLYYAHRLAWLFVYGNWPKSQIDHVDGAKANNRISNLREANNSQNQANIPKKINNTSGLKGVSWSKSKGAWEARTKKNNVSQFLGYFENPLDAFAEYRNTLQRNFGAFART